VFLAQFSIAKLAQTLITATYVYLVNFFTLNFTFIKKLFFN
jgi:hypothetical protein